MKTLVLLLVASATASHIAAQTPAPATAKTEATPAPAAASRVTRNVGTMSELMVRFIYPASDALFYIETRTPKTDAEWSVLEGQALMVAESANLLMLPGRARDQKQWIADAKLMLDAGAAALTAVKAKDVAAISALSDQLLESCTSCHRHYRPNYGKPPPPKPPPAR